MSRRKAHLRMRSARFDISHNRGLSDAEIAQVGRLANAEIAAKLLNRDFVCAD